MSHVINVGCPILAHYNDFSSQSSRPKKSDDDADNKSMNSDHNALSTRGRNRKKGRNNNKKKNESHLHHIDHSVSEYTMDRRPIITPFVSSSLDSTSEDDDGGGVVERHQYLLIPQRDRIRVLSMKHGELVTELVPHYPPSGDADDPVDDSEDEYEEEEEDEKDGSVVINTVTIFRIGRDDNPSILNDGAIDMKWANTLIDRNDTLTDNTTETAKNSLQQLEDEEKSLKIPSAKINKDEWVVVAGLNNGTIQEWPLSSIVVSSSRKDQHIGVILPSRIFEVSGDGSLDSDRSVTHLASCQRGILYALISKTEQATVTVDPNESNCNNKKRKRNKKDTPSVTMHKPSRITTLVQIGVPSLPHRCTEGDCDWAVLSSDVHRLKTYINNRNEADDDEESKSGRRQKGGSVVPFLLSCSIVPNDDDAATATADDLIAVTVVSRRGFQIHYLSPSSSPPSSIMESFPSSYQDDDITTAAISPNRKDLALGYGDGTIQIHVSLYQPPPPPNRKRLKALIRRVHWHALPVKILTWLGAGRSSTSRQSGAAAPPLLVSGGEEAVIALWNLEIGNNKPMDTLPRVTKGCITHLATNGFTDHDDDFGGRGGGKGGGGSIGDIIVRCSDSTLHLLQGHNHTLRWKIQGLATPSNECAPIPPLPSTIRHHYNDGGVSTTMNGRSLSTAILRIDPRTGLPILTRLAGAPGTIHWFQPSSSSSSSGSRGGGHGRVAGCLEIVPYNRISRRHRGMDIYPRPIVTAMAMGVDGMDMVTVDVVVTEDGCALDSTTGNVGGSGGSSGAGVGGVGSDDGVGVSTITTIKFWRWVGNDKGNEMKKKGSNSNDGSTMPYDLVSAMTCPHGKINGTIDAIAITNNGSTACSLATEEGSFHIWRRINTTTTSTNTVASTSRRKKRQQQHPSLSSSMVPKPAWKRDCRISIPAGYSNSLGNNDDPTDDDGFNNNGTPLTFSPDGSVLTIAFGRHITVWDYNTSTLLNTVLINTVERVKDLKFLVHPKDMLLAVGNRSVSLVSPCSNSSAGAGGGYTGGSTWCYRLPSVPSVVDGYRLGLGIVTPLSNGATIAVAIRMTAKGNNDDNLVVKTRIVLIDAGSGRPKMRTDDPTVPCYWTVKGNVDCMCDITTVDTDGWKLGNTMTTTTMPNGNGGGKSNAILLVLTHTHNLLVLSTDDDGTNNTVENPLPSSSLRSRSKGKYGEPPPLAMIDDAPILPLGKNKNKRNKKNVPPQPNKDTAGGTFAPFLFLESTTTGGGSNGKSGSGKTAAAVPTQRLPPLTSAITSAFLSSQFRKKEF